MARRRESMLPLLVRRTLLSILLIAGVRGLPAEANTRHPSFEIALKRMDVDVDGAPNAYGPPGKKTLDYLSNAHSMGKPGAEIVGYLTDDDDPRVPIVQGLHDPYPGYYVSTTHYVDRTRRDRKDPLRYVD